VKNRNIKIYLIVLFLFSFILFSFTGLNDVKALISNNVYQNSLDRNISSAKTIKSEYSLPTVFFNGNDIELGNQSAINVVTDPIEGVYAISLKINYDPSILSVEKIESAGLFGDNSVFLEKHETPGTIIIGYSLKGDVPGISMQGSIFRITFDGIAEGTSELQFADEYFLDKSGKIINNSARNFQLDVYSSLPPNLTLSLSDGLVTSIANLPFTGKTEPGCKIFVNGNMINVSDNGDFNAIVTLTEGNNSITVIAVNKYGVQSAAVRNIILKRAFVIVLQIGNPIMQVNGANMEIDPGRGTAPLIMNSRTLLPIRTIVETLGGTVLWDAVDRKVTVDLGVNSIEMWIGKPQANVNGQTMWIDDTNHDVVPEIINSRTMLPLRFISEKLGAKVQWDGSKNSITITYGSG
jgi:hypothetical protein